MEHPASEDEAREVARFSGLRYAQVGTRWLVGTYAELRARGVAHEDVRHPLSKSTL